MPIDIEETSRKNGVPKAKLKIISRQSLVFVLFCFLKYDSFNVPDILNIHKIALFQKSFPLWYRFCVHDQRQFSETQPAERTQGKQQLSVIVIKYLSHIGDSSPPCQLLLWAIIWTLSIYRMSYCWGFVVSSGVGVFVSPQIIYLKCNVKKTNL